MNRAPRRRDGDASISDREPSHKAGASTLTVAIVATVVATVGEIALFDRASTHAFLGNSDGATVVLEGQWMSAGHLALSGWDLSLDSFWTLDAFFYAAAVRLVGVHAALLNVVPSVIACGIVAIGVVLALSDRRSNAARLASAAVVFAVLGFPGNTLAYVLLQGPWHVATALFCLGGFWALGRPGRPWRVGVAVVLLSAAILGDTQSALLGLAPVLGASGAAAIRRRSWRAGISGIVIVAGVVGVAFATRAVARAVGTFAIATGYPKAHARQMPHNLVHIASWGASLLGHGALPTITTDNGAGLIDLIRVVGIVIVVMGALAGAVGTVIGMIGGPRTSPADSIGWRIDDLLVFGILGDLVLFVGLTPNDNGNYARYLTTGVIFSVILAARTVGRLVDRAPFRFAIVSAAFCGVILVLSSLAFIGDLGVPGATQNDRALANYLEAHNLRDGVGDYWSASITTVESADRVRVRPVISDPGHHLVRFGRQSAASWYRDVNFTFVVYDLARPWRNVNATTAIATFGRPAHIASVGTYRILIWARPFQISTVGYSRK